MEFKRMESKAFLKEKTKVLRAKRKKEAER